jgi:hypothetical protein
MLRIRILLDTLMGSGPDPDPACHFDREKDPDPTFHFDAYGRYPDPSFQMNLKTIPGTLLLVICKLITLMRIRIKFIALMRIWILPLTLLRIWIHKMPGLIH